MLTVTLQINNDSALETLRDMEASHSISILERSDLDSPALSGAPLSLIEFRNWIGAAESTATVSLNQAKEKWANKRKQLQKPIR